ncbi:MAG TPA: hypothetical protein VH988_13645 [Thermoanaerobaculia bacterium]|nr:hypothetical protein [Thermoanaerobaculia bacterium]
MRAEPRKATSKSAMAARARMVLIADLGWLEGVPLLAPLSAAPAPSSLRWLAVPAHAPAVEMEIGRAQLSRAVYAVNKLRGEHAAALPSLAEEPEAWLVSVERRLELLKRAVHHGAAPPAGLWDEPSVPPGLRRGAAALAAAEPVLEPLLATLSWLHAGHPGRLRAAHSAVADWARGAALLADRLGAQESLVLLIRLAQLAMDHGEEKVAPLAAALFDERVHGAALGSAWEICDQILRGIARNPKTALPETLPPGRLGRDLAAWCETLVQQSPRAQRQALRLFALATPIPLAARWAGWWQKTGKLLREARAQLAPQHVRKSRQDLRVRLEKHRHAAPPAFSARELISSLDAMLAAPRPFTERMLAALRLIPAEATEPGRLQMLCYWAGLRPSVLLEGFLHYLERRPAAGEALLSPWREIAAYPRVRHTYTVEDEICERPLLRREMLAAYQFLAELVARYGALKPAVARQATELVLVAGDADRAAPAFASLYENGQSGTYFQTTALKLALHLCREHPNRFAGVLAALNEQAEQSGIRLDEWPEPILTPLSTGELGELVCEAIVNRQVDRLLTCGVKVTLLDAAGVRPLPLPVIPEPAEPRPAWIDLYPEPLRPALCRLAAVLNDADGADDAESKVARWLGDDFPLPGRLEREIAVLTAKLAAGGGPELAIRLASLRERLAHPAVPAPARLERLAGKLGRAWERTVLDRWTEETDRRLPEALKSLLGLDAEPPAWLREPGSLDLLAAATRLTGARRRLAYRLFRLRCGPPPWDLRDAPENRRFVESLPDLDWAPWIDGLGSLEMAAADGRRLFFTLEDDPLEIFRMGGHFQTCLSPGSFNYYSVFANAADINKRVLYARDAPGAGGRIVGRCLLAITAHGELLTFSPYCHDGKLGFDRLCDSFAAQLAQRMRAPRVAEGVVPTLVAPAWYDDGSLDLGGRHPALQEGSPLRRRLAVLTPPELIGELRRALKPARLDQATLPLVIELPELAARPELAVPLLRPVAECRTFPDQPLVTVASLALQAGAADLVRSLFGHTLATMLRRTYRRWRWVDSRLIDLFLRLDPARLLAFLRDTRQRGVRDWLEETDASRLEQAADALIALHRPRQAREIWQRLATSHQVRASDDQRQRAQQHLNEHARKAQ